MKAIIILLFSLFSANLLFSQERAIRLTNENSVKEIIIKEDERIIVKTIDGQKVSGKFIIDEDEGIMIKQRWIELSEIEKIKRDPLLVSLITTAIITELGVGALGVSLFPYVFSGNPVYLLFAIPPVGIIYAGFKSPNFLKGYKAKDGWKYEIVRL